MLKSSTEMNNRSFFGASPRRWSGAAALSLALALLIPPTATAEFFEDEAARQQIVEANKRLRTAENAIKELGVQFNNFGKRLGAMEAQNQELRDLVKGLNGQIQELGHILETERTGEKKAFSQNRRSLKSLKESLKALGEKMETLGEKMETLGERTETLGERMDQLDSIGDAIGEEVATLREKANIPTESELYNRAFMRFQQREYQSALDGFAELLQTYPEGRFVPNARYWIGNARFALGEFHEAIVAQRELIEKHPDSDKVPDSLLNIAAAQEQLGNYESERATLADLIERYPTSLAADKARQRIDSF